MIYDPDEIDIMGVRKDNGLDMAIISSGPIDASPETQTLLLDKVENYLEYTKSKALADELPNLDRDNISIIFWYEETPPAPLLELCERIVDWAMEYGVKFIAEPMPEIAMQRKKKLQEKKLQKRR